MLESISVDRVLSILGLLTGLFFFLKSRSIKRLDVTLTETWLQGRRHPEIRIFFREQEIPNLSRVRILFSNTGTRALRLNDDFSSKFTDGIRIVAADPSSKILSAALLGGDVETSAATVLAPADGTHAVLKFEYLNPGQRVAIEVLFTGPRPRVEFEIVGGKKRLRTYDAWLDRTEQLDIYFGFFAGLASIFIPSLTGWGEPKELGWPLFAIAMVVTFAVTLLARRLRRRAKQKSGITLLRGN